MTSEADSDNMPTKRASSDVSDSRGAAIAKPVSADVVRVPPVRQPLVGVIMGSDSDLEVMRAAVEVLQSFDVPHEVRVISAHRTPDRMLRYAQEAADRGLRIVIAGAGGAAHLPGMVASSTRLPVIGVPVSLAKLDGLDSLLSIVQMPAGIPVATMAINGARNAGLLAVRMLAMADETLAKKMDEFQRDLADQSSAKDDRVRSQYS